MPRSTPILRSILLLVVLSSTVAILAESAVSVPLPPDDFTVGDPEVGRELFVKKCAQCHGESGDGEGRIETDPRPRDLRDRASLKATSAWETYLVIRDGGEVLGLSKKMFGWGKLLEEQELRDITAFVRTLSASDAEPAAEDAGGG